MREAHRPAESKDPYPQKARRDSYKKAPILLISGRVPTRATTVVKLSPHQKRKARIAPRPPTTKPLIYCTVNVTPCECVIVPSEAVTVTLNVPTAVGV